MNILSGKAVPFINYQCNFLALFISYPHYFRDMLIFFTLPLFIVLAGTERKVTQAYDEFVPPYGSLIYGYSDGQVEKSRMVYGRDIVVRY